MKQAYDEAIKFHRETFRAGSKEAQTWLSKKCSMQDVVTAVDEAKNRYSIKKMGKSGPNAAMASWWTAAASKVMHYSQIIDTFVSSNPEYAALAWGGLRFIFTVRTNLKCHIQGSEIA